MKREEAIKILLKQWECVDRNAEGKCDRKCGRCDLAMDDNDIKDAFDMAIKALEQKWPGEWHETFEDNPGSFPDDDRLVLMTFSNCSLPAIGRWETDDFGGAWYLGDEDKPLNTYGIYVDGWWELPQKGEE